VVKNFILCVKKYHSFERFWVLRNEIVGKKVIIYHAKLAKLAKKNVTVHGFRGSGLTENSSAIPTRSAAGGRLAGFKR